VTSGVVLAPPGTMSAIAIESGAVKTVDPRRFYTQQIPQPAGLLADRFRLDKMVTHGVDDETPSLVRDALERLHVTTVCVPPSFRRTITFLRRVGYEPRFRATTSLQCLEGHPTESA
jgi:hypothetical protein